MSPVDTAMSHVTIFEKFTVDFIRVKCRLSKSVIFFLISIGFMSPVGL